MAVVPGRHEFTLACLPGILCMVYVLVHHDWLMLAHRNVRQPPCSVVSARQTPPSARLFYSPRFSFLYKCDRSSPNCRAASVMLPPARSMARRI